MSSMRFPSREEVEKVRNEYPKGCRVVLERMDDMQAPPIGTEGTVRGVDDTGSIMVKWDNGSSLHVVYGEDQITTICYGKKDTWQSREEAQAFFLKAMAGSEGSEQERCATIYTQLCLGMTECRDEVD